jgi:hypothetical protein
MDSKVIIYINLVKQTLPYQFLDVMGDEQLTPLRVKTISSSSQEEYIKPMTLFCSCCLEPVLQSRLFKYLLALSIYINRVSNNN